jgi:hypothetical protein
VSLPFRLAGQIILKAFDVAIAVSEWNDRRLAAKRSAPLTYKDVERINQASHAAGKCPRCGQVHPSNATCPFRTAHTIIIPRPKP